MHRIHIKDGVMHAHRRIDPAIAARGRRYLRDRATHNAKAKKPVHEMFAWSLEEEKLLRQTNPELFEGSAFDRQRALKRFARTTAGQAFLCR